MTYETSQKLLDRRGFRVTYETITADSCEAGDAADRGWLDCLGDASINLYTSHWDLQDLARLKSYRFEGDGGSVPNWVSCEADMSDLIQRAWPWGFLADCPEESEVIGGSISIHRPNWITDASWLRVCRSLGWKSYN